MPDEVRYSWTNAICEKDWIDQRGTFRPPTPEELEDGVSPHALFLTAVEMPVRAQAAHIELERCAWCGDPTIFGVWVRVDPATLPFPRVKDD